MIGRGLPPFLLSADPSTSIFLLGVIFSFANAVLVSLNLVGAAETTVDILAVSLLTQSGNNYWIINTILLDISIMLGNIP